MANSLRSTDSVVVAAAAGAAAGSSFKSATMPIAMRPSTMAVTSPTIATNTMGLSAELGGGSLGVVCVAREGRREQSRS